MNSRPRIGIVILPEQRWARDRRRWEKAEQIGFDHAWTYDHLAWRSLADGPWFSTIPLLTAAAVATSKIKLGTWVSSPNFREPVTFAKEIMGLDDIADGRFQLGIGAGGAGYDSVVYGHERTPGERVRRLGEFLPLLKQLLTRPVTDFQGEFYTANDARMIPGLIAPQLPFVVAANGPKALLLAAHHGTAWATNPSVAADDFPTRSAAMDAWWSETERLSSAFDAAAREAKRDPAEFGRFLSLDSAPIFSLSSAEFFEEALERAGSLGFTDVVSHWPRADGVYAGKEDVLDEIAQLLR